MIKNDNNTFGRLVKELRLQIDLTQEELADKSGCATISIRRIEAGTLRPSTQLAEQLAVMLEVHPDEQEAFTKLARGMPVENGHGIEKYAVEKQLLYSPTSDELKMDVRHWRHTEYLLTLMPIIFAALLFIVNPSYLWTLAAIEPPFLIVNVVPCGWLVFGLVFGLMMLSKYVLQYGRRNESKHHQFYRTGINGFVLLFMTFPALLLVLATPALLQMLRSGAFDPK